MGRYDIGNCWNRDRKESMLTADHSMSFCQFPDHNILDSKIVQANRCSDDIHDGVYCANLMEMNVFQSCTVGLGFCFPQNCKNLHSQFSCPFGEIRCCKNIHYFMHSTMLMRMTVFMMVMIMSMFSFVAMIMVMMFVRMISIISLTGMDVIMLMILLVAMFVIMLMAFFMTVFVMMLMAFFMTVSVMMLMVSLVAVFMSMVMIVVIMAMIMTMKVFHIMIMVFMLSIQNDIKITAIKPRFAYTGDLNPITA